MTTRKTLIRHLFRGGFATDFGPTAEVGLNQQGLVEIPFLVNADNIIYDFDGGPRKVGGTSKLNSSAVNSGEQIRGLYDYWYQGTGGSPTQKRLAVAGQKLFKDDADGSFSELGTNVFSDDTAIAFATFDDKAFVFSSALADNMVYYDGNTSTLTTLTQGGSPRVPSAGFGVVHKNRMWAAGDLSTPSTLYYSANEDPTDWTGAGSGTIAIDPNDGDRIIGIASHKNDLWVFKGPYKGSIHRINGSAPTGSDAFARTTFIEGIGAAGHNLIFRYHDDLGFMWTDGSTHSLAAVASYGDFYEATLSRPINSWLRDKLTVNRLDRAWAKNDPGAECVLFVLPIETSTDNNIFLCMDHSFGAIPGRGHGPISEIVRWSKWPAFNDVAGCVALVTDQTGNNVPTLMAGGNDGFVRKLNRTDRSIDGTTAYTATVTTPFLNYGNPMQYKIINEAAVGIEPRGNYDLTFGWQRDDSAQQTQTVAQGGGDVLGGTLSEKTITGTVGSGSIATITTSAAHGFTVGQSVVIYGTTNYNGRHTILTVPTVASFTFSSTATSADNTGIAQGVSEMSVFVLGTSTLGGSQFVDRYMDLVDGGEFRSIQYEVSQGGLNRDLELHSLSTTITPGAHSTEN